MGEHRLLAVIALLQVVVILGLGVLIVLNFPIWAPVDEGAHFNYIQHLAEERSLPVLGAEMTSDEVAAIFQGVYPRSPAPPPTPPKLGDLLYEGFQPPLYYLLALPAYSLSDNHLTKATHVRWFDWILLAASLALLCLLCRSMFPEAWLGAYALALNVFLVPGVLVRMITIANTVLEPLLVLLFLLVLWRAYTRPGMGDLVVASVVLGLCLLTKVTLVHLAPLLVAGMALKLWPDRRLGNLVKSAAILAIPLFMMSPWMAFNYAHFGSLTANELAKWMQFPLVNPIGEDIALSDLGSQLGKLKLAFMPAEWQEELIQPMVVLTRDFMRSAFFVGPAVLAVAAARRWRDYRYLLLGLPMVLNLTMLTVSTILQDFEVVNGRYLYSSLPGWALLFVAVSNRFRGGRAAVNVVALVSFAGLLTVWASLVPKYL